MKKTVIKLLVDEIENDSDTCFHNLDWYRFDELIKKSEKIFKQQINEAYNQGQIDGYGFDEKNNYYNETFKSEQCK
jgi:hypothetical protein